MSRVTDFVKELHRLRLALDSESRYALFVSKMLHLQNRMQPIDRNKTRTRGQKGTNAGFLLGVVLMEHFNFMSQKAMQTLGRQEFRVLMSQM